MQSSLFGCQAALVLPFLVVASGARLNATKRSYTSLVASAWSKATGFAQQEEYTTNAMCSKKNCVNPIFPGLEELHHLSEAPWQCSNLRSASPYMSFCRNALNYDPALPEKSDSFPGLREQVKRQDSAAASMYFYHLAGLGLEPWDYQRPDLSDDDCIRSMWRLTCYTYFPRAPIGCEEGHLAAYLRPCQSSCMNYIRQCGVECCDESVRCVFTHSKNISATQQITTAGYAPHDGPSSLCTGAARRSAMPNGAVVGGLLLLQVSAWAVGVAARGLSRFALAPKGCSRAVLVLLLAATAVTLQGCEFDVPTHSVGRWRAEEDYLIKYEFVPPGSSPTEAIINSCGLKRLSQTLQCSGRGVCKMWEAEDPESHTSFCECDRDWADPECGTQRKSQAVAYMLSVFLGPLGADQFYLGSSGNGLLKLLTLGGGGVWWVYDIIRVGSAPVQTTSFRVAADLPHWIFVLVTAFIACLIGFVAAYVTTNAHVAKLRKDQMLQHAEEEAHRCNVAKQEEEARWDRARRAALNGSTRVVAGERGWPSYDVNYGTISPAAAAAALAAGSQPPGAAGRQPQGLAGSRPVYPATLDVAMQSQPMPAASYGNGEPRVPLDVRAYASEWQGQPPTSSFNL